MRAPSYPPFVVFFDTIAMFLFVLILNQGGAITLELPEDRLIVEAKVIYQDENTLLMHDASSGAVIDLSSKDVYFVESCGEQRECIAARNRSSNREYSMLLPDTLTIEMSKITTLAMRTRACSSFVGVVMPSGRLDRDKTLVRNPCLLKLQGIDSWIKRTAG